MRWNDLMPAGPRLAHREQRAVWELNKWRIAKRRRQRLGAWLRSRR